MGKYDYSVSMIFCPKDGDQINEDKMMQRIAVLKVVIRASKISIGKYISNVTFLKIRHRWEDNF
jgi:hypothetical protein